MAAREQADFKLFQPALERVLELTHRYIACFDGTGEFAHPYDVLLDDYEPSLTTEELRGIFAHDPGRARPARLSRRRGGRGRARVPGPLPAGATRRRSRPSCSRAVGYDPEYWRLDPSVHPFARSMAHTDVRLTTRWEEDDLAMAFYSCLHEFGHGLYEAQMDPRHYRTTLARGDGAGRPRVPVAAVGEPRRPLEAVLRVGPAASCASTSAGRSRRSRSRSSTATSTRSGSA